MMAPSLREPLSRVEAFARARGGWWIVGGLLRDQLLGRALRKRNVDFALASGAVPQARALAAELSGAFVPLDEAAGCARVVVGAGAEAIELDLCDVRGGSLEADLRQRDFTINALAMPLAAWVRDPDALAGLIDPLDGRAALRQRRLIPCFPGAFAEDPVRILRAFRFVAELGMALDPAAMPLMQAAAPQLARVSMERVRDELLAICETDAAAPAVRALNDLGALDVLVPELLPGRGLFQGGYHHLDVLGHQLETVAQADRILADAGEFSADLREPMMRYCAVELVPHRSRKALIKLAGLVHDVGKPARRTVEADGEIWFLGHEDTGAELADGITARLRLSNHEADLVRQLVQHHLRPGFLSREPQLTRRAIYRFFKTLGEHGPACLFVWWSDRMATRGPKSRLDQLDQQRAFLEGLFRAYFFQSADVVKPPRLLDGHALMRALSVPPGPLIGELLGAIEEAQAEGAIRTPDEALALARLRLGQPRPPA